MSAPEPQPPPPTGPITGALVSGGWLVRTLRSTTPAEALVVAFLVSFLAIVGLLAMTAYFAHERWKMDREERRELIHEILHRSPSPQEREKP